MNIIMTNDFEIVESTRTRGELKESTKNKLEDALADNMGKIIDIAKDVVDIQRMRVQSEAILAKMAEDRKMLTAEAEAYVMKKNADTKTVVDKMKVIQDLLRDFYAYNQVSASGLSGEEFTKIISDIIQSMS